MFENIPKDIITNLNEMKTLELQLEYLGLSNRIKDYKELFDRNPLNTIEEIVRGIGSINDFLRSCIPEEIRDFLNSNDYDIYTKDNHGRSFWNEIPTPELTDKYFTAFCRLVSYESSNNQEIIYALDLYDMGDETIYFETEELAEEFIAKVDCDPFCLGIINENGWVELYTA